MIGLSLDELEQLTMGMVFDMLTEAANDRETYDEKATQEDFDNF